MRSSILSFVLLSLCIGLSLKGLAWGRTGHHIVAEIAFRYLDNADKEKIMSYLGGMSIEDASTWLDEVRSDPQYSYTAPWHYVDFPKGTTYQPTGQPNIINALSNAISELENKRDLSPEQTRFDLLVIIHLVGDLHQPLHVGYAEDKGGNDYQVSFPGKGSNLHRVWDSEIIDNRNIAFSDTMGEVERLPGMGVITANTITDWMSQTRHLTESVYPKGHKIDENYILVNNVVIQSQLTLAGLRLAAVLQQVAATLPAAKKSSAQVQKITEVSLDRLSSHIGETVQVCGHVYGTKYLTTAKNAPTFINVGAAYPNSPLTLLIWQDVRDAFSYKPDEKLDGKDICVTGKTGTL